MSGTGPSDRQIAVAGIVIGGVIALAGIGVSIKIAQRQTDSSLVATATFDKFDPGLATNQTIITVGVRVANTAAPGSLGSVAVEAAGSTSAASVPIQQVQTKTSTQTPTISEVRITPQVAPGGTVLGTFRYFVQQISLFKRESAQLVVRLIDSTSRATSTQLACVYDSFPGLGGSGGIGVFELIAPDQIGTYTLTVTQVPFVSTCDRALTTLSNLKGLSVQLGTVTVSAGASSHPSLPSASPTPRPTPPAPPTPLPTLSVVVVGPTAPRHTFDPAVRIETNGITNFSVLIQLSTSVGSLDQLRDFVRSHSAVARLIFTDEAGRRLTVVLWDCSGQPVQPEGCAGTLFQED